jgi:hypothetical protein
VHDNPRPSDDEQELAQTDRLDEEEDMRGGQSPDDQSDDSGEED